MKLKLNSSCENDTIKIAQNFANKLNGDETVLLEGDLGAGKTFFVKSIVNFFKCNNPATSPTFTIMQRYDCNNVKILHFDLYRIKSEVELENFGFYEFLEENAIKFIEWSEKAALDKKLNNYYKVNIKKTGELSRTIYITKKEG